MMKFFDEDCNNMIDFNEFVAMYRMIQEESESNPEAQLYDAFRLIFEIFLLSQTAQGNNLFDKKNFIVNYRYDGKKSFQCY